MTPTETTYITTKVKQNKKTPGCVRLYAKKENEVRSIHGIYHLPTIYPFEISNSDCLRLEVMISVVSRNVYTDMLS